MRKKIVIIVLALFILYNMFSAHRCVRFFCFLNQREGLVANRDNIAKNSADIHTLIENINTGISKLEGLNKTITEHTTIIPINRAQYNLIPAISAKAEEKLNEQIQKNS